MIHLSGLYTVYHVQPLGDLFILTRRDGPISFRSSRTREELTVLVLLLSEPWRGL